MRPFVKWVSMAGLLACYGNAVTASELSNYKAAEVVDRPSPTYPYSRRKLLHAGFVAVEFVVDKNGDVQDPAVRASTHPDFEENSLWSVKKYSYKPALLNGKPVLSRGEVRVFFSIRDEERKVSRGFAHLYQRVSQELMKEVPDKEKARRLIKRMARTDRVGSYGLALLSFVEWRYAKQFSSELLQLEALEKLLMFEGIDLNGKSFLAEKDRRAISLEVLSLRLNQGFLGEAQDAYSTLKDEYPNLAEKYTANMAKVQAVIDSGQPFPRTFELGGHGNEFIQLVGQTFYLQDIKGSVDGVVLRCQANATTLQFSADNEYRVPKSWGKCSLQISGDVGTTSQIVQLTEVR